VYAILDFVHDLQEGLVKAVLATSRVVWRDNRDVDAALADGVPNLVEWAESNGVPASDPFRVPSRNAKAHNDWRIEGDVVVLCELKPPTGGPVRVNADQLVDHGLALAEFSLGLYLGMVLSLGALGIDAPDDSAFLMQAWERTCTAVLVGGGWEQATVSIEAGAVKVEGHVARPVSLVELTSLLPFLPEPVSRVWCEVTTDSGPHRVQFSADLLRAHSEATDELTKTFLFAQFMQACTVDGVAIASKAHFRKAIVVSIAPLITATDVSEHQVSAAFRSARGVAVASGDSDLERALRVAQGWRSARLSQFARPIEDIAAFTGFMSAQLPEMRMYF
jgi:hypothetical protein